MLELPVAFTTAVDNFVAHSGPKFSYTLKPLGNEFFIASHSLLFEQGVQTQTIEIEKWNSVPVFFKTDSQNQIPYDIFAASFFLLTRYEEALPHLKTKDGFFDPSQSLAAQNGFMKLPLVDLWTKELNKVLTDTFPAIHSLMEVQPKKDLLIEVTLPFRYKYRSPLIVLEDFFRSLWTFKIFSLFQQIGVLLRLKRDPYESFSQWNNLFASATIKPKVFFLFSNSSAYESTVSIFNLPFQRIVKRVGDFFSMGLLVSMRSQIKPQSFLNQEKNNFQMISHRPVNFVRMSQGIKDVSVVYSDLVEQEFRSDYSMGYPNTLGFRASTATPFNFYNLSNEFQLPLKVYPVFATEKSLLGFNSQTQFTELEQLFKNLPLSCSRLIIAVTNGFLNFQNQSEDQKSAFTNYIK
ncbi:MAG: hypothetical protein VW080_04255 [Flavobacteriaceae bacterium]